VTRAAYTNVQGGQRTVTKVYVNVAGTDRVVTKAYVNTSSGPIPQWRQWWPPTGSGPPPITPGVYFLTPTSQSIPSGTTAWALFNTAPYLGRITDVRAGIYWKNPTAYTFQLADRAAAAGSIARDKLAEYDDRLIYHTMAAASLAAINAGSSTGFTVTKPAGVGWDVEAGYFRLRLEVT
jgi:hypothetical protein